jgi:hypothetical protein
MAHAIMMEGAAIFQRDADHGTLGSGGCLGNRLWHFARLAMTKANPALAITNHNQSRKAKALAALYGL